MYRGWLGRNEASGLDESKSLKPSPELEGMLKRILDQTQKLEAVPLGQLSAEGVAQVDAQVQVLKKDLQAKEAEINSLKQSGNSKIGQETGALSSKIKELETKLAEYEILEDDIADLSLYKEENTRLRVELEKIKGGGAPSAAPPANAAPVAEVAAPPAADIVSEFASAAAASPTPAPSALEDVKIPDTGNPMADFESTVKIERQMQNKPAPTGVNAGTAPAAVAPQAEADDLFAEFSKPSEEEAGLDTDKMMAEMAALVSMEPAAGSALEDKVDTDKMAIEANFNPKTS